MRKLFLLTTLILLTSTLTAAPSETLYTNAQLAPTSGTATLTIRRGPDSTSLSALVITATTTTGGDVLFSLPTHLHGKILYVITDPASESPTDNWDLTLIDAWNMDLLAGSCLNRDTANVEVAAPKIGNGTGVFGLTSAVGTESPRFSSHGLGSHDKPVFKIADAGSEKELIITILFIFER